MDYKILYTKSAVRDLDNLESSVRARILEKVSEYISSPDPLIHSKALKGFDVPTYRFRVGDYRVVFRLDNESRRLVILVVLKIQHRREVYRN